MPTLYFNNFRGFKDTFLPLKSMNFFVGENSTGKTSVLKLIKLLSERILNDEIDFNRDNVELGYFSEITNYGEKYFEIGYHDETNQFLTAIKLRFIDEGGLPFLKNVRIINYDINLDVEIDKNDPWKSSDTYLYKCRYSVLNIDEVKKASFFYSWINKNFLENNEFTLSGDIVGLGFLSVTLDFFILSKIRADRHYSIMSEFLGELIWLAPIRTEPRRTYDSYKKIFNPDGSHTPYVLKDMIGDNKIATNKYAAKNIIEAFGKQSGLFDKIEIAAFEKSETAPFEIRFFLNNNSLKITNVGYGISQILPIITEIIARPPSAWFAIQQPEIHLHPKAQAAFGEFVFSFLSENKNFIIETHSDYIIDRFRLNVNKQKEKNPESITDSQVVFFKRTDAGNEIVILPILEDGSYPEDQPKEFREFFIKEQINLLSI